MKLCVVRACMNISCQCRMLCMTGLVVGWSRECGVGRKREREFVTNHNAIDKNTKVLLFNVKRISGKFKR